MDDGKFARITPDNGGYKSQIDTTTTANLRDVVMIETSPRCDTWRIETSNFYLNWPEEFDLYSNPSDPLSFWSSDDRAIVIQSVPTGFLLEDARPDLRVIKKGASSVGPWVEYQYVVDKRSFTQRNVLIPLSESESICVTLQTPTTILDKAVSALETLMGSIGRF